MDREEGHLVFQTDRIKILYACDFRRGCYLSGRESHVEGRTDLMMTRAAALVVLFELEADLSSVL